jgi:hypothetical protein
VEAQLATVVDDHDGAARHLAARARGGGHGDQRHRAVGDQRAAALDGRVGLQRPFVRGGYRHALGQIDAAAAAHGDQAVAGFAAVDGHRVAHRGFGGVAGRAVEHGVRQVAQGVQRHLQHTGGTHAGVGDDQWSLDADAHALAGQQAHDAGVNVDLGQVQDAGHGADGAGLRSLKVCSRPS